jgi:hypothetical protein
VIETLARLPRYSATLLTAVALAALLAACGGGDGDTDDGDASRTPNSTATAGATGQPGATSEASPGRGTPGVLPTPVGTTATGSTGGPVSTVPPGTPSPFEATIAAEAGGDISGGDPSAPREPVATLPPPPPGVTPAVDPPAIAPAEAPTSGLQFLIDVDAAAPGIQSSRTVDVGDVFRIAVMIANAPEGVAAFNFYVDYDRTTVAAPSYTGGPSPDRNPDLNDAALGGGWTCLPAPEGDLDDPGGIEGDGNPATGRALLSCFNLGGNSSGTLVLATVEFHALASGSSDVSLAEVSVSGSEAVEFASCATVVDTGVDVPCVGATVIVQ